MNICYLSSCSVVGGGEVYAIYLAKEAKKVGHNVSFVLGEEGKLSQKLKEEGLEFSFVRMPSSFNPVSVFKSTFQLRKYVKENGIEIVHTQYLREHSLAIGAKIFGSKVKIVRTFHRLDQFNWKMRPLLPLYNALTDGYVAITPHLRDHILANGLKESRISLIRSGVPRVAETKGVKALGCFGRLTEEKGVMEFVRANLNKFDDNCRMLVAGDGPDLGELKKLSKQNRFIEVADSGDTIDCLYSGVSVLVLPSRWEVLPFTVLKAYSAGVPVVSFDIEPLQGIVTEETGGLVGAGDYETMFKVAKSLLEDNKALTAKSAFVKSVYAKDYTVEQMWQKTEALYKTLLG